MKEPDGHRPQADGRAFERFLNGCVRRDWVVYAEGPFGGPQQVLKYLVRYTHRVAIANRRLIEIAEGRVRFGWKEYADGNRQKVMSLDAGEFLRRFPTHTLPPRVRGGQKVRRVAAGRHANDQAGQVVDISIPQLSMGNKPPIPLVRVVVEPLKRLSPLARIGVGLPFGS